MVKQHTARFCLSLLRGWIVVALTLMALSLAAAPAAHASSPRNGGPSPDIDVQDQQTHQEYGNDANDGDFSASLISLCQGFNVNIKNFPSYLYGSQITVQFVGAQTYTGAGTVDNTGTLNASMPALPAGTYTVSATLKIGKTTYTVGNGGNYTFQCSGPNGGGPNGGGPGGGASTPELDSGSLLAMGLVAVLGIPLYRRYRRRQA